MRRHLLTVLAVLAAAAAASPPVDPPRGDLRVVVLSDLNGPYGATRYAAAVHRAVAAVVDVWRPDLVLLAGDLVAGQSHALPDDRFAAMWAAFDAAVAAPLRAAGIPYAAALGNHDASKGRADDGGFAYARERAAAAAYWADAHHREGLDVVDAAGMPFAWSFRRGGLFVAVVDASGPRFDADERDALAATLASPAARDADLRWVLGHLPPVGLSEGRDRAGEVLHDAERFWAVLQESGVDTYVAGHHGAFYAAAWGGVDLLAAPGVVGGRSLRGTDLPARPGLVIVDVGLTTRSVSITPIDGATLAPFPPDAVPDRLAAFGADLERSTRVRW